MIKNILSIAGSDPSGGAGIQADLKTFGALGCHGMAAMSALTAQNTQGVTGVHMVPAEFVFQQLEALFTDSDIAAVKIGMAGAADVIEAIASALEKFKPQHIVLDPVMVATSGDVLLQDNAIAALKSRLIPLASVVTPNIPEAEILADAKLSSFNGDLSAMAHSISSKYQTSVLLKGGHLKGKDSADVLIMQNGSKHHYSAPRIDTKNTHGTGCTLSSAIACYLGQGFDLPEAVQVSKDYLTKALSRADELSVGHGHGPVHHFWKLSA